jgi:hypothetical protein
LAITFIIKKAMPNVLMINHIKESDIKAIGDNQPPRNNNDIIADNQSILLY